MDWGWYHISVLSHLNVSELSEVHGGVVEIAFLEMSFAA